MEDFYQDNRSVENLDNRDYIDIPGAEKPIARRVTQVDSSGTPITPISPATSLGSGRTVNNTAGTAVVLSASTAIKWVTVQALQSNNSVVAVGGSAAKATLGSENGVVLNPGGSILLSVDNLADVFFDVLTNGEGVSYTYGV